MAWANHARCLHCGVRLPLYRKLTDGEFCSASHRKAFQEDQSRMAIERLRETQQQCHQPAASTQANWERDQLLSQTPPPVAGKVEIPLDSRACATAEMVALDPLAYELTTAPAIPRAACERQDPRLARAAPSPIGSLVRAAGSVRLTQPEALVSRKAAHADVKCPPSGLEPDFEIRIAAMGGLCALAPLQAVSYREAGRDPQPVPPRGQMWLPLPDPEPEDSNLPQVPPPAGLRRLEMPPARVPAIHRPEIQVQSVGVAFGDVALPEHVPVGRKAAGLAVREEKCFAIGAPGAAECRTMPAAPQAAPPSPSGIRVALPVAPEVKGPVVRIRSNGRLIRLQQCRPVEPPPTWGLKAFEWTVAKGAAPVVPGRASFAVPPLLPFREGVPIPLSPGVDTPRPLGYVKRAQLGPEEFPSKPMRQGSRLRPLHEVRETTASAANVSAGVSAAMVRRSGFGGFMSSRSVRLAMFLMPAVLLLVIWQNEQETQAAGKSPVSKFVNERLTEVKMAIQNRAGVELLDDFRMGLDNWEGNANLTRSWSYDQTGFVKPGPLALYRPSVGLSEYTFEFLGQIDRRALGWVYRAQDMRNYHVAKLVVTNSGPLPTLSLVRYSVIRGRETARVERVLPLNVHRDTVYRVRMEARGGDFSLYVQNQMVQFWSDWRLPTGGVGFFSGRGEQSRIRWMQVSHQYDAIGKLCAYFAPMAVVTYNLQPAMGARTK